MSEENKKSIKDAVSIKINELLAIILDTEKLNKVISDESFYYKKTPIFRIYAIFIRYIKTPGFTFTELSCMVHDMLYSIYYTDPRIDIPSSDKVYIDENDNKINILFHEIEFRIIEGWIHCLYNNKDIDYTRIYIDTEIPDVFKNEKYKSSMKMLYANIVIPYLESCKTINTI
jgi:hypothetical protein